MKISTKGRYGLRLMVELGMHYPKNIIPLKLIAENQEISEKYLEQIINQLNKAGLVKSVRGSQGGYQLAVEPEKISVGQILQVLEGSLAPVPCLDFPTNTCSRCNKCPTLDLWSEIHISVKNIVDNKTLASLVEIYKEKLLKMPNTAIL